MADTLKQKTISGVSWSFVEQILVRGFNFVVGIILARLLLPSDYGLIGMLGLFIGISQIFIDGGFASALVQSKNPSDDDYSTVYIINVAVSLAAYLILFFTAPLIARFYNQPILIRILRFYALILVIGASASVQNVILTIRVDFKTKFYISSVSAILGGIAGIIAAYADKGVWALVIQSLVCTGLNTILTFVFVKWWPRIKFSIESFHRLFSFGSKLLVATIISVVYDNIYPLVIGKRFTAADTGQFSRAGQFPGLFSTTIGNVLNRVAFPVLSKIQDDDRRLLDVYGKYVQLSSFIIFPLIMGLCGCARPIVSLLLTDKWLDCVPLMQIICFACLFDGIILINLNLLYVKGRSDLVLRLEIIKKSIAFLILVITCMFSIRVMCYGRVLYALIALYLNTIYTKKLLGLSLWDQLKSILPYLAFSLVILGESALITWFIPNNWLSIGLALIICPASYYILCSITEQYAFQEAKGLALPYLKKLHITK